MVVVVYVFHASIAYSCWFDTTFFKKIKAVGLKWFSNISIVQSLLSYELEQTFHLKQSTDVALELFTVVSRLTTMICSRKIAVKRKHHKAKLKTPLKCVETHSMRSNGVKTHHSAKILHTAAIFSACIPRNPSLSTAQSHFKHPVAILKPPRSAVFYRCKAKIGSRSREPIVAKRNSPI